MAARGKKQNTAQQKERPRQPARGRRWPWVVVSAALLVRVVFLVEYAVSPLIGYLGVDDLYYLTWAGRIAAGNWLGDQVFEQGPLYAYLLAVFLRTVGERIELLLAAQMLTGVAVAWLVYDSGRRLFDRTTGAAAGILAAAFGPLVYYECMVMKSFLSPLLTMVALNATLRSATESRPADSNSQPAANRESALSRYGMPALAGAAVGLACLIQEYHLLLLLPLAAAFWFARSASGRQSTSAQTRLVSIGVLLVAALLCILPCTLRNWVVAREFVVVTAGGGEVFYMAHGPQAAAVYNPPDFVSGAPGQEHEDFRQEASRRAGRQLSPGESSRYWFRQGLSSIAADPLRTLKLTILKAGVMLNDYDVPDSQSYAATREFVPALRVLPSFGWIGGLGLVGMALCWQGRRYATLRSAGAGSDSESPSANWLLPLGLLASHAVPLLLFYNFGRFRIGMMPLWILFAAHAAVWIVRSACDRSTARRGAAVLLSCLALGISAAMFSPLVAADYRGPDAIKVALLAMQSGDYELAERALKDVVAKLRTTQVDDSAAVLDVAHVASVWQMMGQICLRTGRLGEGVEYFGRLRQLPARNDIRERSLRAAAMQLQRALHDHRHSAIIGRELSATCAALRRLRPDTVAYWALSAVQPANADDANEIERGLAAAQQPVPGEPAATVQAWRYAGEALLARYRGDPAASTLARRALAAWPDHPLQIPLKVFAHRQ